MIIIFFISHNSDKKAILNREYRRIEVELVTAGKCSLKLEITYGDKSYRMYDLDRKHHEDKDEIFY